MRGTLVACCFLGALAQADQGPCSGLEADLQVSVRLLHAVADQVGAMRRIGDRALADLRECPDSARLWYLAARSAEVLGGQDSGGSSDLHRIVADALSHAPASAPVVTVGARVERSSTLAQRAMALDPNYQPARRALAEALARDGDIQAALDLAVANDASGPMHLTRARVLLAANRYADAVREARKISPSTADEMSLSTDLYRDSQEALGFALLGLAQPTEAQRALRAAASAGSAAARAQLANWQQAGRQTSH